MNNEKVKKESESNKKYDLEERLIQFTLLIIDPDKSGLPEKIIWQKTLKHFLFFV